MLSLQDEKRGSRLGLPVTICAACTGVCRLCTCRQGHSVLRPASNLQLTVSSLMARDATGNCPLQMSCCGVAMRGWSLFEHSIPAFNHGPQG